MLTQERLKALLKYDEFTGIFRSLVKRKKLNIGDVAGCLDSEGYRVIRVDGKSYKAHRLAFLYMTGAFPAVTVDHIDGDPSNNVWKNLRPATYSENNCNRASNPKSGMRGVYWLKGKWRASVRFCGKPRYLGVYDDIEEAAEIAALVRVMLHGEYMYS